MYSIPYMYIVFTYNQHVGNPSPGLYVPLLQEEILHLKSAMQSEDASESGNPYTLAHSS